jgi:2-oxoglutarate ferredoxin oxidoreductase subunit alpha
MNKQVRQLDRVVIRFAGDSGDGMQLTGDRFTSETAALGNDISTLPNFPAEIRAPAGTLPGVSSFQVHFADYDCRTAPTSSSTPTSSRSATSRRSATPPTR